MTTSEEGAKAGREAIVEVHTTIDGTFDAAGRLLGRVVPAYQGSDHLMKGKSDE